jgi:hypothetical protein
MGKILFDIWAEEDGLTSLCFSGEIGEEARCLLGTNPKIIHSFYADSHFDAMTQYNAYLGLGVYESDFEIDKEPYKLEELQRRARLRIEVDKILWDDWDPLGINDVDPKAVRDEYKSYVPEILNLAMKNGSAEIIADRLLKVEKETMGLIGHLENCQKVAEKILMCNSEYLVQIKARNELDYKIMHTLLKQLWFQSDDGNSLIQNMGLQLMEVGKFTGQTRDYIRIYLYYLIDNGYIELVSKKPLLFQFTLKGNLIKSLDDIKAMLNTQP